MTRRGVALIAVLWVIALLGAAAAAGLAAARDAVTATQYRIGHRQARWAAEGCLARARSAADGFVRAGGRDLGNVRRWTARPDCDLVIQPAASDSGRWAVVADGVVRETWAVAPLRVAVLERMLP